MAQEGDTNPYWHTDLEILYQELGSNPNGLTTDQVQGKLKLYGPNQLTSNKKDTPLLLFLNQFKSPIILLLLLAVVISALVQDPIDATIILIIVIGSAVLSFSQEYSASKAAEQLKAQISHKVFVRRNGDQVNIPTEEVVPGDIILLSAGSLVPADGVVTFAKDAFVNQAVLTGETFPVEKKTGSVDAQASLSGRTNVVFMGTSMTSGEAEVLAVLTGTNTVFGQIAKKLKLRPAETEFERGIRRLGYLLSEIMLILVLAIFAFNILLHKPFLDSLLFSIALAVGLTPQLLPAVININLSKGAQAMAQSGVIVRRLASIENFGSMDTLCTDKTGTLTKGVVELDQGLDPQGRPTEEIKQFAYLNASFQTGMINPLDQAIVTGLSDSENQLIASYLKIDEIPYDFIRKRLTIVVQGKNDGNKHLLFITKGAFNSILSVCSHVKCADGTSVPIAEEQSKLTKLFDQWSEDGYRVLGIATRLIEQTKNQIHPQFEITDEKDMTFIGFLLFLDQPKDGVQETIQELNKLGVELKIITGDNKPVAVHTAQAVGLTVTGILTGAELNKLSDDALLHKAEKSNLFVEVDPNQKERIISSLRKMGHVVGYMGDGINDAPSLHNADVGISVENAVDVAKEAADFVLLKNDLDVLQQGILGGRKTFANTMKYIFMATSANFGNMFSMAGASLILPFLPMLPKQILLINFLTDLPEMTIANDYVDDEFIQKPHRWSIDFIRRFMLVFGPISSIFDFITFGVLLWGLHANQATFHTGWFIESIVSASIVVFALRTRRPFFRSQPSKQMLLMTIFVILVALFLPYSPLANILGFSPLPWAYLLVIGVISILYFIADEYSKRWFFKRYNP